LSIKNDPIKLLKTIQLHSLTCEETDMMSKLLMMRWRIWSI